MKKIKSSGYFEQKQVEMLKVIRTNLAVRGNGINDPIRIITQYWTLEGEMLFEVDPMAQETMEENA